MNRVAFGDRPGRGGMSHASGLSVTPRKTSVFVLPRPAGTFSAAGDGESPICVYSFSAAGRNGPVSAQRGGAARWRRTPKCNGCKVLPACHHPDGRCVAGRVHVSIAARLWAGTDGNHPAAREDSEAASDPRRFPGLRLCTWPDSTDAGVLPIRVRQARVGDNWPQAVL